MPPSISISIYPEVLQKLHLRVHYVMGVIHSCFGGVKYLKEHQAQYLHDPTHSSC